MMTFIFFLFVVVLSQVIIVAVVAVTTPVSTLPVVDQKNINKSFPGIYSVRMTRREQQQQKKNWEEWGDKNEPIWLQMDVIQMDCEGVENDHQCYVHTLIQSCEEYDFLQSKLMMMMIKMMKTKELSPEQQQQGGEEEESSFDSSLFALHYNATLSQKIIEPGLAIQRHYVQSDNSSNNSTTTTTVLPSHRPRFLNSEGYSSIATRDCFLDYDGMMEWIQDFIQQANATGLLRVEWKDVGDSYLKTVDSQQGNDIHVLTIKGRRHNNNNNNTTTNNNNKTRSVTTPAPFVLLTSMHPREYAPPELVRRFLVHILQYVQKNQYLPPYLQTTQIHWFPYVNVDGRQVAETIEPWRRKNLNKAWNDGSDFCSDDAYGVDLNRNFPFQWGVEGGSSSDACSPLARGTGPGSEPETQAVIQYAKQLFPQSQQEQVFKIQSTIDPPLDVTNNRWMGYNETTTIGVFVDIHSYGQAFIFPWGYVNKRTPNHDAIQATVNKLQYRTNYQLMGPGDSFYGASSGATDDAHYALFGALSMTWEIGLAFHEECSDFETPLPSLIQSLEYLASIAPQPYRLGQGPDIVEATVTPTVVVEGDSVTLTVKVSDTVPPPKNDGDNTAGTSTLPTVVEVRVYMDHPTVVSNQPVSAMWVLDTNNILADWTENAESNVAVVLSKTLSWEDVILAQGAGDHVWYIQALDGDGYWGPVIAIPITVNGREGLLPEKRNFASDAPSLSSMSSSFVSTTTTRLLTIGWVFVGISLCCII